MDSFDIFEKNKSLETFSNIVSILDTNFSVFKDNCDFTDSTNLNYSFTYVILAHMGGSDLIHVYFSPDQSRYYLRREITQTCPIGSPHSGLVDERTKDITGFSSVSKQAIIEMAIDRLEWIKACNYTQNSKYQTEANNCIEILKDVKDLTEYSEAISRAEQRYQWIKKLH